MEGRISTHHPSQASTDKSRPCNFQNYTGHHQPASSGETRGVEKTHWLLKHLGKEVIHISFCTFNTGSVDPGQEPPTHSHSTRQKRAWLFGR